MRRAFHPSLWETNCEGFLRCRLSSFRGVDSISRGSEQLGLGQSVSGQAGESEMEIGHAERSGIRGLILAL